MNHWRILDGVASICSFSFCKFWRSLEKKKLRIFFNNRNFQLLRLQKLHTIRLFSDSKRPYRMKFWTVRKFKFYIVTLSVLRKLLIFFVETIHQINRYFKFNWIWNLKIPLNWIKFLPRFVYTEEFKISQSNLTDLIKILNFHITSSSYFTFIWMIS